MVKVQPDHVPSACVDDVVVFTRLGRGDAARLLAATPILLLVQLLLQPVYLGLFLGGAFVEVTRSGSPRRCFW